MKPHERLQRRDLSARDNVKTDAEEAGFGIRRVCNPIHQVLELVELELSAQAGRCKFYTQDLYHFKGAYRMSKGKCNKMFVP